MNIRIEIAHPDGKDRLHLVDPSADVQTFAVAAFFDYCKEASGEASLLLQMKPEKVIVPPASEVGSTDDVHGERPHWWDSGIKIKDGVPHYRAHYWCSREGCEQHANQYVKLTDKVTECHNCKTEYALRPATNKIGPDGLPEPDRFGNFFRADRLAREAAV